jgi:hypothetical protein
MEVLEDLKMQMLENRGACPLNIAVGTDRVFRRQAQKIEHPPDCEGVDKLRSRLAENEHIVVGENRIGRQLEKEGLLVEEKLEDSKRLLAGTTHIFPADGAVNGPHRGCRVVTGTVSAPGPIYLEPKWEPSSGALKGVPLVVAEGLPGDVARSQFPQEEAVHRC